MKKEPCVTRLHELDEGRSLTRASTAHVRRDGLDVLKKLEKDKAITEDELKKLEKDVQECTKNFEQKMDEAVAHKEKEVMEV